MHTGTFGELSGQIQADETFIGGKARNMHSAKRRATIPGRGPKGKVVVARILERGGDVHAVAVPTRRRHVLQSEIREHVLAGSAIFTDETKSYEGL
jgi:transposase-like protein